MIVYILFVQGVAMVTKDKKLKKLCKKLRIEVL